MDWIQNGREPTKSNDLYSQGHSKYSKHHLTRNHSASTDHINSAKLQEPPLHVSLSILDIVDDIYSPDMSAVYSTAVQVLPVDDIKLDCILFDLYVDIRDVVGR